MYPSFWLQGVVTYYSISNFAIIAYEGLIFMISFIMLVALFTNTYQLRRFIIAFIVAGYIGLPFWAFVPSISPQSMYLDNILNSKMPENVVVQVENTQIDNYVAGYLPAAREKWVDPKGESFAVSTFPSMHVAWGTLVLVVGTSLYFPLAIILLPWYILNFIGTMTTFEHYAVDGVAGILLAVLSLYIAKKMLNYENKYHNDKYNLIMFWSQFVTVKEKTVAYFKGITKNR